MAQALILALLFKVDCWITGQERDQDELIWRAELRAGVQHVCVLVRGMCAVCYVRAPDCVVTAVTFSGTQEPELYQSVLSV